MTSRIAFRVAVANTKDANVNDILDFVESQSTDATSFRSRPSSGVQMSAGDYLLVFNTMGSIASIAGIIWMAYEKFIAAKKDQNSNTAIVLNIAPEQPEIQINFWLGGEQKNKDEFVLV